MFSRFLLVVCLVTVGLSAFSCVARADAQADEQVAHQFQIHIEEVAAKDPAGAVKEAQEFVRAHTALSPWALSSVAARTARLLFFEGRDTSGAIALLDEVRPRLHEDEALCNIEPLRAQFLVEAKRFPDAEAALKAVWPSLLLHPQNLDWVTGALPTYAAALAGQNRAQEVVPLARQVALSHLSEWGTQRELAASVLAALQDGGAGDEALSWAKLYFMLCPYSDEGLAQGTKLLVQTWINKEMSPRAGQAFVASQTDPALPNPLAAVSSPVLSAQEQGALVGQGRDSPTRVSLDIALGDLQGAVREVRKRLADEPTSPDAVREVCRVLKAHDLGTRRANAFLVFYTKGEGDNPLPAFLQELQKETKTPPAPATAPVNTAPENAAPAAP